jgi:hypothetical protein
VLQNAYLVATFRFDTADTELIEKSDVSWPSGVLLTEWSAAVLRQPAAARKQVRSDACGQTRENHSRKSTGLACNHFVWSSSSMSSSILQAFAKFSTF